MHRIWRRLLAVVSPYWTQRLWMADSVCASVGSVCGSAIDYAVLHHTINAYTSRWSSTLSESGITYRCERVLAIKRTEYINKYNDGTQHNDDSEPNHCSEPLIHQWDCRPLVGQDCRTTRPTAHTIRLEIHRNWTQIFSFTVESNARYIIFLFFVQFFVKFVLSVEILSRNSRTLTINKIQRMLSFFTQNDFNFAKILYLF